MRRDWEIVVVAAIFLVYLAILAWSLWWAKS